MWYRKEGKFELKVFTDADWARILDDRKSTTGGAFFMGDKLVTWISTKQGCISQSTAEAECVATTTNCSNIAWIKQLMKGMNMKILEPIIIFCDNASAINISKNPVMHAKNKHIAIKYHYLREQVQEKEVILEYVQSKEQLADIFTKPLPKDTFEYLRKRLGV